MKKTIRFLLAGLLAVILAGGSFAYLRFSPQGAMISIRPEDVVQQYLDKNNTAKLREIFVDKFTPETTEFESADEVAGAVFDSLAVGEWTFRKDSTSEDNSPVYILSCGGKDLLFVKMQYSNRSWQIEDVSPCPVQMASYSETIVLPSDSMPKINGVQVPASYITQNNIPYEDMSSLEKSFSSYAYRVEYVVDGLYLPAEITAEREGGLLLTDFSSDGNGGFRGYTVPDAAGYAFRISVPENAKVEAGGAALTEKSKSGTVFYPTRLDIPEELAGFLPVSAIYEADGLYATPEIIVWAEDGTELVPMEQADGTDVYLADSSDAALYDACHERVEEYLVANCSYGAGYTVAYYPAGYCVMDSDIYNYYVRAVYSLIWVNGVSITYNEVSSSDYIPLGENAFICRGHVDCKTVTGFQTNDLLLDYEMLWRNFDGTWLLADMAFV